MKRDFMQTIKLWLDRELQLAHSDAQSMEVVNKRLDITEKKMENALTRMIILAEEFERERNLYPNVTPFSKDMFDETMERAKKRIEEEGL